MVFSLNYLNTFFKNKKLNAKEVEVALNELGIEVEGIEEFSDVKGLLFAKVLEVFQNPNSDRLDVVKVETKQGVFQIQTNNRILKPGDLTICFPVGSSKGEQVFGEVTLKGEISQGMMGALAEIGYNWELLEDQNQLLVLPNDFATIEDDPMVKLGLDDIMIETSVTANRNDANSYYVLAKELASFYDLEFTFDIKKVQDTFVSNLIVNSNDAEELTFLEVKGNTENSFAEKLLLAKHGISSKFSWAVNLTNLTLINFGVPTHVYDRNKIGSKIEASYYTGKITVLGGKEVEVNDVLAIKDENKVISLASVMGLEDTKADLATNDFAFEIGIFSSKDIRHGAKEIKLNSNASNQGSRKISKELAHLAMLFVRSYCSNLELSQIINPIIIEPKHKIAWDEKKLTQYSNITNHQIFDEAKQKLTKLGFEFSDDYVLVPNYRYDIQIFEDIIEEIFRFYSYANFPALPVKNTPLKTQKRDMFKKILAHSGFSEARTFSLVSNEKNFLNPFNFDQSIALLTFVSKEREEIRNSIITSLAEVVEYNQKRKMENINLFEKGMINNNHMVFGFASTTKTFDELKQDIVNFTKQTNLSFVPLTNNPHIHPNCSARIEKDGKMVGWIGKIHPKYDQTNAFYAEILKDVVLKDSNFEKFVSIDNTPLKSIDLTFELSYDELISSYIDEIKQTANIFEVKQLDDYKKADTHNVTIRVYADDENIQKLIAKYN
ncbi:phenylalanine--tRNA ligase subunit beta [Mycoplasmopsis glycophila]|uniref:Phenylalanine--tRNA ligase beta subunit n=1 Tax=Mycoplasmopsis glycophila TaxID=171285 RepID=A0A449AVW6_9BACT|nr:phenylalanine--tRNA ligase subunit beta [Mycoplasmopsis glycophila]VEU70728.1 Phenylalanine--tRNA ligase beta subunit [Mycoplasmopsis glycophila]